MLIVSSFTTFLSRKEGANMQHYNKPETQIIEHEPLFANIKKTKKTRKWREIEELKSRRELLKELQEIDPTFNFSLNDLV